MMGIKLSNTLAWGPRNTIWIIFCFLLSVNLSGQLRLNVEGNARIEGEILELVKPADPSHVLTLSSGGAAMDINVTTDLYINSGRNILLDANTPGARVGIGTTGAGPQAKLHVVGERLRLSTPGNENRYLDLRTDGAGLDLSPVGGDLYIDPGNNNLILATQDGRVGIGTLGPPQKLSVVGNTRIEGRLELFKAVGDSSLFIGLHAGQNDGGQNGNTFLGTNAGRDIVGGAQNVFIGYDAGMENVGGNRNVFIGYHTARNSGLIAGKSVFIGDSTGVFSESQENVFIGSKAGRLTTSGYGNTFIGYTAGTQNNSGYSNTFIGRFTGGKNDSGYYNVFMGASAGNENRSGHSNTFLGLSSGYSNTKGNQNTFVGRSAGSYNVSGTRNTYIGNETGAIIDSLDRAISIGYGSRVECHNCAAIGGEGEHAVQVGIGTATPGKTLDVVGEAIFRDENKLTTFHSTGANAFFSFENNGGTAGADVGFFNDTNDEYFFINTPGGDFGEIVVNGGNIGLGLLQPAYQLELSANSAAKPVSSTWIVPSDKRLKKNIRPFTDGLEVLLQIDPVWYEFNGKAGIKQEGKHIGVLAQEMQRIAPYTTGKHTYSSAKGDEQYLNFDANALFYIIINAVKEQAQKIEQKEERLDEQAAEIRSLKAELEALKAKLESVAERVVTASEDPRRHTLVLEPEAYLSQNQPNPFHRKSLIRYFIPESVQNAQLQLTDESGRVIARLDIPERGSGEVLLKAKAYPAGIYFYTLVLDGQIIETKKMVLTF